ncbi:hypothetical protein BS78_09G115800 [Paspalum vaginatum]|uniref:SHSP domain-containing protein n=1 Tax=Paspalum vaginatum TaxID=158149 RepID=A0A9W7X8G4_9POAL|nr:hypothetical protein BS78_K193400 [Paspalum vaginatum]KAJ1262531.1 hypothetical protein BS78_09G115400 [Paspalum vaginatum]KAJ1262536.1 hypothetical protein BS78_09G115800 [Paspalum vaginatum]
MAGSYTTAVTASLLPVPQAPSLLLGRGSWRPAAVALRPSAGVKCRRPLTVTCALPEKERSPAFSIPPTALLCPVPPPDGKERWDIKEEEDHVTLWLQVPGLSADDIEVTTGEDVLEIKRKFTTGVDAHGVGAFHIRLLMTKEYDGSRVTADLKAGMLEVTVPKNSQRTGDRVQLGATQPRAKESTKNKGTINGTKPDQTLGKPKNGGGGSS